MDRRVRAGLLPGQTSGYPRVVPRVSLVPPEKA